MNRAALRCPGLPATKAPGTPATFNKNTIRKFATVANTTSNTTVKIVFIVPPDSTIEQHGGSFALANNRERPPSLVAFYVLKTNDRKELFADWQLSRRSEEYEDGFLVRLASPHLRP